MFRAFAKVVLQLRRWFSLKLKEVADPAARIQAWVEKVAERREK
jgi:hypothetical protein